MGHLIGRPGRLSQLRARLYELVQGKLDEPVAFHPCRPRMPPYILKLASHLVGCSQ